jgi:hypothetical protein
VLPCVGAAIGVASYSKPDSRFRAEATIAVRRDAVNTGAISGAQLQVGQFAAAAMVPEVIEMARAITHSPRTASEIARGTTVVVRPGAHLVQIGVRDASEAAASALASALARTAVNYVRVRAFLAPSGTTSLGAFEDPGGRPWGGVTSRFATPPRDMRPTPGSARFGSGKLQVTCPANRPCGASTRLYGSFRKGTTYTAEGWIRSRESRVGIRLVLGMTPTNRAVSPARRLRPEWRRIRVSWTPRRHAVWTDVVFRTASADRHPFELDGVVLLGQPRRVGLAPPASLVSSVAFIDTHRSVVRAALIGALGGFVVALGAVSLAWLARRRGRDQAPTA